MLDNLKNKKILILGFGREGQDTFKFLRKLFPNKVLGIADQDKNLKLKAKNIKLHLGKGYLKTLKDYDIIIKSPGIPFKILPKTLLKKITSQTEIFFENCPETIIGVAGTKGKSTTASFIYQTLKQGLKIHPVKCRSAAPRHLTGGVVFNRVNLIGNIGKPVLSLLPNTKPNDIYVYELSSFQLMKMKKSPQIAVLLNSYPDHLDWHKDFDEYLQANANITRYQTPGRSEGKRRDLSLRLEKDFLIYNSQDKLIREIAKKSRAKKIAIRGKYYDLNIAAAKAVAKLFKVKPIKKYNFLPHRLEFVGKFKKIEFYNDSLSVIPETVIEALDFLGDKVQTLILGGFDRGLCFKKMAKKILKSKVKTLILFPSTGQQIWQEIKKEQGKFAAYFTKDMKKAVKIAYKCTNRGKICLLSPASASFNLFKDYKERGNLYKKYVKKYGKSY